MMAKGSERMTATEELRRMLDARGVEWVEIKNDGVNHTRWKTDIEEEGYCYYDEMEGVCCFTSLSITRATPEQAIAATLGGGECERVKRGTKPDGTPRYRCSNCGHGLGDYRWAFCPKCGRKIRKAVER